MRSIRSSIGSALSRQPDTVKSIVEHVASKANESQTYVARFLEACLRSVASYDLVPEFYQFYQVASTDQDAQRRATQYFIPSLLYHGDASWPAGDAERISDTRTLATLTVEVCAESVNFPLDLKLSTEPLDTPAGRIFIAHAIKTLRNIAWQSAPSQQVELMLYRTGYAQGMPKDSRRPQSVSQLTQWSLKELERVKGRIGSEGTDQLIVSEENLAAAEHLSWTTRGILPSWLVSQAAPRAQDEPPWEWDPTITVVPSSEPVAKWIRAESPARDYGNPALRPEVWRFARLSLRAQPLE